MTPTLIQRPDDRPETVTRRTTTCPDCDADLVNGQGLAACVDCDWSGTYE
ncbi:hypothetical protein [Halomarina litorea]|nr:hypothetical protein [Halomarina sp. BCD28]